METARPPNAGIARREGRHSGRVWAGHRAGRGRTRQGVEDRAARHVDEAGWVPSVGAKVSLPSKSKYL